MLPLVLFPQKSPPPINQLELPLSLEGLSSPTTSQISCIIKGLLKAIHDLSDADIIDRSKYDMSFKYFLDMKPEEDVIDSSSLTKKR